MRLKISKSKNSASLYVTKTVYENGKERTITVEKLGTEASLREKLNGADPYEWARQYIQELNQQEKVQQREVIIKRKQSNRIPKDKQTLFNGGYLFLQQLYHSLKIHKICDEISDKYKFSFDLDSILSRLVYGRILFPASKLGTLNLSKNLLEQPDFEIQHIYRALEVIAKESSFIQAELYKNSCAMSKRNDRILYYDCTNYFFEIEQADGLKQYGKCKQHQPLPIVEMGLFLDGDGIPLAFSIHSGNTNEQVTLRPLEKQLMKDFKLSRFIVCTDAGLSSTDNRRFNNQGGRAFITTQSVKKLKDFLKQWALDPEGWLLVGDKRATAKHRDVYDIRTLEETEEDRTFYENKTFFKERWIKEDGLEQRLIVTYSIKYRNYQRNIRQSQLDRAAKLITANPSSIKKRNQNDYKRFVKHSGVTLDGEVADKSIYSMDTDLIATEAMYDGFYAVCTNLEDEAPEIAKINHRRWEIEESFRIMKTDFKARPVYLSRDDRIEAHFTTCFLALTLFRYLEKKLEEKYTSTEIIQGLRDMNFYSVAGEGFIPTYTRTDFTDDLHDTFGFRTDYEIVNTKLMKKIYKDTKS